MGALKALMVLSMFIGTINQGQSQDFITTIFDYVVNYIQDKCIHTLMDDVIQSTPYEQLYPQYDYIVVGGGSAGSVIARRLTDDNKTKVLLLEAGFSETRAMGVPFFASLLQWTGYNWGYTAEPQDNACKAMEHERCGLPHGRGLGGGSVIDYMLYSRGNRNDFDKWAVGNPGWDYVSVLKYFKTIEKVNLEKSYSTDARGTAGPLNIETPYHSNMTDAFIAAGVASGQKEFDYNGGDGLGYSYLQATQKKGARLSIARAYLEDVQTRSNLHILTGATATKIIINANKVATGVQFTHKRVSYVKNVTKEVIVSAGPYGSPKLLMLSGIGPQNDLKAVGVQPIMDLPVGRNLHDHITYSGLDFFINQTIECPLDAFNPMEIYNWISNGKGPLTSLGGFTGIGLIKTNVSIATGNYPDVALVLASVGSMHTDYGWFNRRFIKMRDEYYMEGFRPAESHKSFSIFPTLLNTTSRGYVKLNSTNPMDDLIIRTNYLSTPVDRNTLIAGIRAAIQLVQKTSFQQYGTTLSPIPVPDCGSLAKDSDAYWTCAIQRFTNSIYHEMGTCSMGNSTNGVVDNNLRVFGIQKLRVADTSVVPLPISAYPSAVAVMIGEKASDLIKSS